MNTYGKSRYNGDFPCVEYRKPDYTEEGCSGYYDEVDELIYVNKELNPTIEELTKTIIHEYTHYVKHPMEDYYVLSKYLNHDDNPMEKEATYIEERDYKKCMTYLSKINLRKGKKK
jgi:Zn-dependent peptidase ImmA (M78 family)